MTDREGEEVEVGVEKWGGEEWDVKEVEVEKGKVWGEEGVEVEWIEKTEEILE